MHRRPVYIYLLNVPSFSSRYFNKIKRTSRLGRLLALSLEILWSRPTQHFSPVNYADLAHTRISIPIVQPCRFLQSGRIECMTVSVYKLLFSVANCWSRHLIEIHCLNLAITKHILYAHFVSYKKKYFNI